MVKVESLPSGFYGTSCNGIMSLQVSDTKKRIYYQLHPGESLFVGSHTVSIVPEEYRDIPPSPSGYGSFRERVNQHVSQLRSSLGQSETPVHHWVRSIYSSPAQAKSVIKQAATLDGQRWASDPVERNLLGIIREVSKRHTIESPDYSRGKGLIQEDSIVSAINDFATTLVEKKERVVVPVQADQADSNMVLEQMKDSLVEEQKEETIEDFHHSHPSLVREETPPAFKGQDQDNKGVDGGKVIEDRSGKRYHPRLNFVGFKTFLVIGRPYFALPLLLLLITLSISRADADNEVAEEMGNTRRVAVCIEVSRQRKRPRLATWGGSSPGEVSQGSMKSNIIVQGPTHGRNKTVYGRLQVIAPFPERWPKCQGRVTVTIRTMTTTHRQVPQWIRAAKVMQDLRQKQSPAHFHRYQQASRSCSQIPPR